MARNVFSVPIFFIFFRETLEAVIVHADSSHMQGGPPSIEEGDQKEKGVVSSQGLSGSEDDSLRKRKLIRKMRFQIFAGSGLSLLIAAAIGATFIAIWPWHGST